MPKVNAKVMTPDGMAVVDSNDMLKKIVTCKVFVDDTYVMKKFPLDQITVLKPVNNPPHGKKKDAVHDEPDEDGDDEE